MFLLVAHFRDRGAPTAGADRSTAPAAPDRTDGSTPGASTADQDAAAVALLAAQPTTRWVRWAGSTERAGDRVLVAEFDSAADYRRALSPFDVRTTVVPWLSTAQIEPTGVYEVRAAAGAGAGDALGAGQAGAGADRLVFPAVTVTVIPD